VTISAIGCGLAIEYWQLVVFRLLQGLGSALFSVAAIIVIVEISTSANRGQYISLYWGAFLIGCSLGPTLGGFERLNLREGQVGLTLTLVAAMQFAFVFLAGRLSDKLGRKAIIIPGGIITALGLVMLTQSPSYQFFLLSAVVLGVGRGFGGAVPTAYVADIAQSQNYEHTMALYRTVSDIGFIVGPILLGWLKDTRGLDFPFFLGAGLLLGAIILFAALAKETTDHDKNQEML